MVEDQSLHERLNKLKEGDSAVADTSTVSGDAGMNDQQMKKAIEATHKPVVASEKEKGEKASRPMGPVGLDIGTSHIVSAQNRAEHIDVVKQLNAFFTVPKSKFAEDILTNNDVLYFESDGLFYIFGYSADTFANMFSTDTRRPMKDGLLHPQEPEAFRVIQSVAGTLIEKPKNFGEVLCFSIPGEPVGQTGEVIYHETVIKQYIGKLGYTPVSINEAMAIVIAELSEDNYTGIGISMGGGMCNVCLSYLSYPVITFSIQKAGDYIDKMVGRSVGEPATKIKTLKDEGLDLQNRPKDRITSAEHIFYDELVFTLLDNLQRVLNATDQIPKIAAPIPIVLSGGTAQVPGCREKFTKALPNFKLPVEISDVRLAEDPFNTTAKGALVMAMTESD
jgi:hypothetical protein